MTKEYRYTSADFSDTSDSCYLAPDDPIHEYMRTGNMSAFNQPKKVPLSMQAEEHQRKLVLAKEMGIKPGTPAWHAL